MGASKNLLVEGKSYHQIVVWFLLYLCVKFSRFYISIFNVLALGSGSLAKLAFAFGSGSSLGLSCNAIIALHFPLR
ncbi:hypothetical protein EDB89DRAFT_1993167 [Lactarius sanguifluus]|nr:hypothetical protein EDB89DRAFT_1993167 [Lactarius sanguifluus]